MYQDFGVGVVCAKGMAQAFEFFSQFPMVVDLSVIDDEDLSILVGHRLFSAFQVKDAQSSVAQGTRLTAPNRLIIGSPMAHGLNHGFDPIVGILASSPMYDTRDSAHQLVPPMIDLYSL
jgi:hypothetical protein